MTADIILLFASLGVILLSCAVFVNAIEWFGKSLNLHQGIVGSILAAIGTALPRVIIPILAIPVQKGKVHMRSGSAPLPARRSCSGLWVFS